MPTVTWARVDPARRAAIIEAAEAEFGAHGFSSGSLNVIARRAGVAKGSLFQYFADKRDLYAFIADIGSQRVRAYMEDRIARARPEPAVLRISDRLARRLGRLLRRPPTRARAARRGDSWRSTPMPASACGRSSTAITWKCCGRWCEMPRCGATFATTPTSTRCCRCCCLIFPHLALAPYMRGLDPILGLDEPSAPSSRHWPCAGSSRYWPRRSRRPNSPVNSARKLSEEVT